MVRTIRLMAMLAVASSLTVRALGAQTPAAEPTARLEEVLPPDVFARVSEVIATARARELPAAALENRALKFAAKGVAPADIERSVREHADRLANAQSALRSAGRKPSTDEVEAGAEAMRHGVDGSDVSSFAKGAPRDRSLAVPLHVLGLLVANEVPVDKALARLNELLAARASDGQLQQLPAQAVAARANRPETGRDLAATKRPGSVSGRPASVPANGGAGARPVVSRPGRP